MAAPFAARCTSSYKAAVLAFLLLYVDSVQTMRHLLSLDPTSVDHTNKSEEDSLPCDKTLHFIELASKPGPNCTDFAPVFNLYEVEPEIEDEDYRPTLEVNFHNRLYTSENIPEAEGFYGFSQVPSSPLLCYADSSFAIREVLYYGDR